MEPNWYILFLTALIPLIVGSIWYSKAAFGKTWMRITGMTDEKAKQGNMLMIFGLTYVFSVFLSAACAVWSVHQMPANSLFATQPGFVDGTNEAMISFVNTFNADYGHLHRTFGHGAAHGVFASFLLALPLVGINALFEQRGWKYIMIHWGYWAVSLILMCGAVCQFI